MQEIYELLSPEVWQKDIVYGTIVAAEYQIVECVFCRRRWQGKQLSELSVELHGTDFRDFVWLDGPELVITARLADILVQEHLQGFLIREVKVVNQDKYPAVPKLVQLEVVGRGGQVASNAGVVKLDECKYCGWMRFAAPEGGVIVVDPEQWDSSDIFVTHEFPHSPLITGRFAQILSDNNISNFRLKPARWSS